MNLTRRDFLVIAGFSILVIGLTIYLFQRPVSLNGAVIDPPKPMPSFTLQSSTGPVSSDQFRGKLVVIYFGYTNCPDICPLTLANLRQALDRLGAQAGKVQVLFISVDWKRDTPEKMARYAAAFRSDFIGLAGSEQQIDAVTKDYGIYYLLNLPDKNGYYSVDHTASTLVLDPQGRLILTWSNGTSPDQISSDLNVLINQ